MDLGNYLSFSFGLWEIDYGLPFLCTVPGEALGRTGCVQLTAENTYDSTGSAILASALTTAIALFVVNILGRFPWVFSEFGFISGTGILFAFPIHDVHHGPP